MLPSRIKLVGEDGELDPIEEALKEYKQPYRKFHSIEEACENQHEDPTDLFVISSSFFFQNHLNQISKSVPHAEVLLAVGKKVPNLAKIFTPSIVYESSSKEEIVWSINASFDRQKKNRRLDALRDHQKKSWNLNDNPAVNLVTNLMRSSSIAESFSDLLAPLFSLQSILEFHDASLLVTDGNFRTLECWAMVKEQKDRPKAIKVSSTEAEELIKGLNEGETRGFLSSDLDKSRWDPLATGPWTTGLAISFSYGQHSLPKPLARNALLVLFRRDLVPFVERDCWLVDMAYGPLSLALEKISVIETINRASKEWRATFDGISEPLTVIDPNYQIIKANKAFANLVQTDVKKIKYKRCFTLLANRRSPCPGCPVESVAENHSGSRVRWQGKDKKDLLVWSYGIRTGSDRYHFQFYRNVSKESHLASALIQSEKMAALGKVVGAIAHEINNPLAGILATSQIVISESKELGLTPSELEDMEEIKNAAYRSKKIISDLLGFTSGEDENDSIIDLQEAARSALVFSKSALDRVKIELLFPSSPSLVKAPLHLVQQILFNLITNAAQAMEGNGSLKLEISHEGDDYKLEISDSGPGISPERLKFIFDPFHTSKLEGVGTGLGLSIVRNLANRVGSKIEVKSQLGRGTSFHLRFAKAQRD